MTCRPSPSFWRRPSGRRRSWAATAGSRRREAAMAPSTTSATEAAFAAALRNRTAPVPAGVLGTPRRFAVYRGNVAAALTGALAARFPITERIVGQDFFRAMAQAYARQNPPRRACLIDYGDGLPAFLDGFEPARSLPYLPDMARLEIARSQ